MTSPRFEPGADVVAFSLRPASRNGIAGSVTVHYTPFDLPLRGEDGNSATFAWGTAFLPEVDRCSLAILERLGFADERRDALVPYLTELLSEVGRGAHQLRAQPLRAQLLDIEKGLGFYVAPSEVVLDYSQNPYVNLGMCG